MMTSMPSCGFPLASLGKMWPWLPMASIPHSSRVESVTRAWGDPGDPAGPWPEVIRDGFRHMFAGSQCDHFLVGGWQNPLKNMKINWNDDIPNIWQNKTCSKPPTRVWSKRHWWKTTANMLRNVQLFHPVLGKRFICRASTMKCQILGCKAMKGPSVGVAYSSSSWFQLASSYPYNPNLPAGPQLLSWLTATDLSPGGSSMRQQHSPQCTTDWCLLWESCRYLTIRAAGILKASKSI